MKQVFSHILESHQILDQPEDIDPYTQDWHGKRFGEGALVLKPKTAQEVSEIVKICAGRNWAIVPQAGRTGTTGGALPLAGTSQIILNVSGLNQIFEIDTENLSVTLGAGCVLDTVQEALKPYGLMVPMHLASGGSCEIGGMISTNAGGILTLRYGNMREQVLGIEAVLADGEILSGLNKLRKNNTGYDLKQLFIGAEGTLGVVTAACLKLVPIPKIQTTAFIGFENVKDAAVCSARLRAQKISCFELMSQTCLDFVQTHMGGTKLPFTAPWYGLVVLDGDDWSCFEGLEKIIIAQNENQAEKLCALRESITESQKFEGASIKHDLSVPISKIPDLIIQSIEIVDQMIPGVRPCFFGHLGDGNIHLNFTQPKEMAREDFMAYQKQVWEAMYALTHQLGGSFSAEHGIGQIKGEVLKSYKSRAEMRMMQALKKAVDPRGMFNPGKITSSASTL